METVLILVSIILSGGVGLALGTILGSVSGRRISG